MGAACAARVADLVDTLLVVDLDETGLDAAAEELGAAKPETTVVPCALDVTDRDAVSGLMARVGASGPLRAVAHAAGVSPTMADWREIITVDLIGTALLVEASRPLVTQGTAVVCFASVAARSR